MKPASPTARLRAVLATLSLAACAAPARSTPPLVVEPARATPDASATAVDVPDAMAPTPTAPRFEGARVLFEAPWPVAERPGLVAAVVRDVPDQEAEAQSLAWWSPPPADPPLSEGLAPLRAQRLSVIDVTGDGAPDLVVWLDPASIPATDLPHRVRVYTWFDVTHNPRLALWTSLALGPLADEAALRAAAPTLRRFVLPEDAPDLDAVMLRVVFATPAQFRSLLSPSGVSLCVEHAGNYRPHMRRCRRVLPNTMPEEEVTSLLQSVQLSSDPADPDGDTLLDARRRCHTTRGVTACDVPTGGPAATTVVFSNRGPARRITRIDFVAYEES